MSVSKSSAEEILAAIERLKCWKPEHPEVLRSGDLSTTNLALEAGISRMTLYRAEVALSLWDDYLKSVEDDKVEAQAPRARVRQLQRAIQKMRTEHACEVAALKHLSDTLAQQVQLLTLQIEQLQTAGANAQVLPIRPRR